MKRREFLGMTAAAGACLALGKPGAARAAAEPPPARPFDLVAVKGGEPGAMFDQAIAALGGLGAFVKKGQKVLVKPNIGWDVPPERAGNTSPQLVAHIVQRCKAAGASTVFVFDHSCDDGPRSYATSGIEKAAKDAGAKVVPADEERYYQEVVVAGGKSLKKAKVHEVLLGADVFINVPVLKHHFATDVTVSMKNLMGVVWDRYYWHGNDIDQCIVDFTPYRKPDLIVVDAYRAVTSYGPRPANTDNVVQMKTQLVGFDPVAVDTAAAKLLNKTLKDVQHLAYAAKQGIGQTDLEKLKIKKIVL